MDGGKTPAPKAGGAGDLTVSLGDVSLITSELTNKGQTTIPIQVRKALRLRQGDEIAYALEAGRVILTQAKSTAHDPFRSFRGSEGDADRRAYADL
ncbi:MAG: type II toxin-antitoxin system PrlF family antitoxin [Elsteraceae bacterium]